MFNILSNLTKAAVAVVVAPVAVVADVVCLPATAFEDTHPFGMTAKLLDNAGKAIDKATS